MNSGKSCVHPEREPTRANLSGAAVIGLNRAMRERLWERVAGMPGRAPKGIPIKKPNAQWIKPGLVGHLKFLKGEGGLRHATLTEVRED
jgi:ATP-dependent DNA ligase